MIFISFFRVHNSMSKAFVAQCLFGHELLAISHKCIYALSILLLFVLFLFLFSFIYLSSLTDIHPLNISRPHPECPERISCIYEELQKQGLVDACTRVEVWVCVFGCVCEEKTIKIDRIL